MRSLSILAIRGCRKTTAGLTLIIELDGVLTVWLSTSNFNSQLPYKNKNIHDKHLRTARHLSENNQQLLNHLSPAPAVNVSTIIGVFRRHDIDFFRPFGSITSKTVRID